MKNHNDQYGRESFLNDLLEGKPPIHLSRSIHQQTKHGVRFSDKWQKKFKRKAMLVTVKAYLH